jgi:hypothetical protein
MLLPSTVVCLPGGLLAPQVNITLNKNSIYGDRSAMSPGGVRIGTPGERAVARARVCGRGGGAHWGAAGVTTAGGRQ